MPAPCGLTIGSFDGVHLGHQALLTHLRAHLPSESTLAVFTFSNHPSHHFTPEAPTALIYPPLQKIKYLKEAGADQIIVIPFTAQFAQTPFNQFLRQLKERLNFSYLLLGKGAAFGKDRQGNEENIKPLGLKMGFEVDYLPKFSSDGAPVSSGRIRTLISQGELAKASSYLGRPYSLMGLIQNNTMHTSHLCLPPQGIYNIHLLLSNQIHLGTAEVCPTTQTIHLTFPDPLHIDGQEGEVVFGANS